MASPLSSYLSLLLLLSLGFSSHAARLHSEPNPDPYMGNERKYQAGLGATWQWGSGGDSEAQGGITGGISIGAGDGRGFSGQGSIGGSIPPLSNPMKSGGNGSSNNSSGNNSSMSDPYGYGEPLICHRVSCHRSGKGSCDEIGVVIGPAPEYLPPVEGGTGMLGGEGAGDGHKHEGGHDTLGKGKPGAMAPESG